MVSGSNKIVLIEGPNLNLVEYREEIYQSPEKLEAIIKKISKFADIEYFQSNSEGKIIDKIQSLIENREVKGIIINPGAYTHYSLAIKDALDMIKEAVKVEVHLTNLYKREEYRKKSVTAASVDAVITGMGNLGYYLAAEYILYMSKSLVEVF